MFTNKNWMLLSVLFLVRFVFALFQRTAFVPDEHWQSAEVAYRLVLELLSELESGVTISQLELIPIHFYSHHSINYLR